VPHSRLGLDPLALGLVPTGLSMIRVWL